VKWSCNNFLCDKQQFPTSTVSYLIQPKDDCCPTLMLKKGGFFYCRGSGSKKDPDPVGRASRRKDVLQKPYLLQKKFRKRIMMTHTFLKFLFVWNCYHFYLQVGFGRTTRP
jgi:hypothetical protein